MRQKTNLHTAALTDRTTVKVRFSEVDSMQIVWHGEYVRYFEDGRESFGKRYGLGYMDIYDEGYMVPIVDLNCQFKQPLSFGEEVIIETRYITCEPQLFIRSGRRNGTSYKCIYHGRCPYQFFGFKYSGEYRGNPEVPERNHDA